jgi:polysaccharide biosynthesis transport protein
MPGSDTCLELAMLDTPTTPTRSGPGASGGAAAAHPVQGIYEFLKANRYTIGTPVVLAALLMSLYIVTAKPMYTAVTHLLIDANLPHILPDQPGDYRAQLDASQVDSQIAILRSDQIAMIVINKLQLLTDPDFLERASFFGAVTPSDSSKTQTRRVMDAFQNELQIRRQGRSYVLEVSYRSDKPDKAAQLADATVDAYIDDLLRARADAAQQGSQWLEGRIQALRSQVNAAAVKVLEFKAKRDRIEAGKLLPQFTLDELESTAQTYRKIYESYLQAHTDSVQRQSYPVSNARVITRITPYKSHPKVVLLLSLAMLLGALLGILIAIVRQTRGAQAR